MTPTQILNEIEGIRKDIKKKYPNNWRVKVANAKSITDMQIEDDLTGLKWHRYYLDNLRNQL
jgi:hypothetical protein